MASYFFGGFEVHPAQRVVRTTTGAVELGARAFDVLIALIERRDRVVTIDELLQLAWPGRVVEENNLSVQIHFLRRVLGKSTIATIRGRGFRFVAPVIESVAVTAGEPMPGAPRDTRPESGAAPAQSVVVVLAHAGGPAVPVPVAPAPIGPILAPGLPPGAALFQAPSMRHLVQWLTPFLHPASDAGGARARAGGLALLDFDSDRDDADAVAREGERALSLARHARGGELLCDGTVASQLIAGIDADLIDRGPMPLCGDETLRVFQIDRHAPARALPAGSALHLLAPVIAVLPLDNLVGDTADSLVGEALADELITRLSQHAELQVVSGLSTRRLRGPHQAPDRVAAIVQAGYVLAGTYRIVQGALRVNVQFQDARTGALLWANQFECGIRDALGPDCTLIPAIEAAVCRSLFQRALSQTRSRALAEAESYSLLFAAIALMHRLDLREFELARELLLFLAARPGAGSIAAAWLANWHVMRMVQGWSPEPQLDCQIALDFVARSLEADSRHALALSIGGLVHAYLRKDMKTAGEYYDTALDANPSEAFAWLFRSIRSAWVGDGADAEASALRALRLSPIDPLRYFFDSLAATAALGNANWTLAEELGWRSVRANRTHASTWRTLTYAQVMLGKDAAAHESVRELLRIEPGYTVSRFYERFPGRDGPMARPLAEALRTAGLPA